MLCSRTHARAVADEIEFDDLEKKKMERKAISHSENSIGKQTASDLSMHYYILLDQITRPSKHVFYLATCWYEPV